MNDGRTFQFDTRISPTKSLEKQGFVQGLDEFFVCREKLVHDIRAVSA